MIHGSNQEGSENEYFPKRKNIQKLIKSKMKEHNKKVMKDRLSEISKVIRVHENLSKLDSYVKKQFH